MKLDPNRKVCASTCMTFKVNRKPCQCYPDAVSYDMGYAAALASMQAEAPQATKDAEDAARYRFLRDMNDSTLAVFDLKKECQPDGILIGGHADTAIDAARKSQGEAP